MGRVSLRGVVVMLALLLGLSAMAYGASTTNIIVITPDNEEAMGWRHTATSLVYSTQYPAECGYSVAPAGTADAPGVGHGGFWGNTGNYWQGDRVNQVFIGTNNYSGVKLSDIKKLYYRAFTADYPTFDNNHFPRTPWQLQLAVTKNSSATTPSRYLMYRGWDGLAPDPTEAYPYQQKCVPWSGEFTNQGHYMTFNGQDCYSGGNGAWVDFLGLNFDLRRPFIGDWDNVLRKYAGGKIMQGEGYYPGTWSLHDGLHPNGTCLSFVIGSPGDETGSSIGLAAVDNFKMCAWLDYFVIGYNKDSDPNQYTEDWIYFRPGGQGYDGAPEWRAGTVASNIKNTWQTAIIDLPRASKGNEFVLTGVVQASPAPTNRMFTIYDGSGSGIKARVKITGTLEFGPTPGDVVRVKGVLHRFGAPTTVPDLFVHDSDFETIVAVP